MAKNPGDGNKKGKSSLGRPQQSSNHNRKAGNRRNGNTGKGSK